MSIGFALKIGVMWFLLIPLLTLNANAEPTHVLGRPEAKAEARLLPGVRELLLVPSQFKLCKAEAVSGDPKFDKSLSSEEERPKKGTIDLNEVAELVGEAIREPGVVKDERSFNTFLDKAIQEGFKEFVRRNQENSQQAEKTYQILGEKTDEVRRHLPSDLTDIEKLTVSTLPVSVLNSSLRRSLRKVNGLEERWSYAEEAYRSAQDRVIANQAFINSLTSKGGKITEAERKEIASKQDEIDELAGEIDNDLFPRVELFQDAVYLPYNFQELLNSVTPEIRSEINDWQRKNQPALDAMWDAQEANRQYEQAISESFLRDGNAYSLAQHLFFREALRLIIQTKNLRPVVVFDARGTLVHSGFYEFEVKDSARELPPVITLQLPENFDSSRFERQIQRLLRESVQATPTFRRFLSCPSAIFSTADSLHSIYLELRDLISRSYRAPSE